MSAFWFSDNTMLSQFAQKAARMPPTKANRRQSSEAPISQQALTELEIKSWWNHYEQRKQADETRLYADWGERERLQSCRDRGKNLERIIR